jgi:proline utilization trans-activator
MLRDEDIDAEMPSMRGLSSTEREDFVDPAQLIANVELTKITGNIISSIYRIPKAGQASTFVQSVHKILRSLRAWLERLPPSLKLEDTLLTTSTPRSVASLHLHFNQVYIH